MQRLIAVLATATLASSLEVTPVQKVIQLLENMKEKGKKEMNEEQVQYAKFQEFCKTTLEEKKRSISEAAEQMEVLSSEIESSDSEAETLAGQIAVHMKQAETSAAEQAKATSIRKEERADFGVTLKDYTESIDAIGRALKVLKEDAKNKQEMALVQLQSVRNLKNLPEEALASIDAFLSKTDKAEPFEKKGALLAEEQAPEPKVFESSTGGILGMLESLQDKFVDERVSLEKDEAKKKHAYELLVQGLAAQEAQAKKSQQEKVGYKAKAFQKKATAESDLSEATSEHDSDTKYSNDLQATCGKKADDFDSRQKLRTEELEAISKAQDIISSEAVSGASLVQTTHGSALAHLRSQKPGQEEVSRFLQQQAKKLNSRVLSAAAIRAAEDPMEKVRVMIEGLITKLNDQATAEATKKGWCDTELATNKATREDKTDTVDTLQAEIDELTADITKLGHDVVTLSSELSELNTAMKEATELRQKEKYKNANTVKDAKEAQSAVAQALNVLKEFYAKAGEATAFVQKSRSHAGQPEIFGDEPYTGMGGENGGVVAMLEVIETDFARLEARTSSAEEAAAKEFEDFMEDSKIDKVTKNKAIEFKSGKKASKSQELAALEADLQGTHKELDAANEYFAKLKPDCLDASQSFAERKAQREEEIKDLEEAMTMLSNMR
eukprot:CAMPEP_0197655554 /NCGR_PEP_ID=MMETSP1338-20131121/39517_1 /TAXON_ID=43686 ORGANISM="Pelagodinium beii, Strain RCC1491" /NCGR_SAMPLE_ID=MMETSP1338 /ASSEMBLY_ACC=CAM_ASM_000754 /LENGTH=668 /DNA_ID=CAMNT_0043231217 /DNA_START=53 /DNA_END=2059 /DNA_ORIENTATION=-